jgi:hypothetical protein
MTYSSSLAINRSRFSGRNQNLVAVRPQERVLGPVSNSIVLMVLACLLGLLYLTQVTKTNAFGYQINSLQQTQTSLVAQHNNLEVASARLQAISRVQNSDAAKNMVAVAPTGSVSN